MTAPELVCLVGYVSLALELAFLAVPSVVSTQQLWTRAGGRAAGRLLQLGVPAAACVAALVLPLLAIVMPQVRLRVVPIESLQVPAVAWCGAALVVLGRGLTLAAVLELRRSARHAMLARDGVFAWSRHPGLVGMHAFLLGGVLVAPCLVVALGFVVYAAHMHRRVLLEEAHLVRVWGDRYRDYAARVARYLGA